MAEISRLVSATALLLSLTGCASLPDVKRIEGNISTMSYSTSVMASSVVGLSQIMRGTADRMERLEKHGDQVFGNVDKDFKSAERAAQNYLQAFLENDRATVKSAKRIRGELRNISETLGQGTTSPEQDNRPRSNKGIDERIRDLEANLKILNKRADMLQQRFE